MPTGPGHQMSQSVNKNLSYRKRGRRLFDKKLETNGNSTEVNFTAKLSKEQLEAFTNEFKRKQKEYNQRIFLVTGIIALIIFSVLGYILFVK